MPARSMFDPLRARTPVFRKSHGRGVERHGQRARPRHPGAQHEGAHLEPAGSGVCSTRRNACPFGPTEKAPVYETGDPGSIPGGGAVTDEQWWLARLCPWLLVRCSGFDSRRSPRRCCSCWLSTVLVRRPTRVRFLSPALVPSGTFADGAPLVRRMASNHEAAGSSPVVRSLPRGRNAQRSCVALNGGSVAGSPKAGWPGSIPGGGTHGDSCASNRTPVSNP